MAADVDQMSHGLRIFGKVVGFKWCVSASKLCDGARMWPFIPQIKKRLPWKTLRGLFDKAKSRAEGRNPEASFAARLEPCPYKAGPKDRRLSWVRKSALHTSTPSGRAAVKKDNCRFLAPFADVFRWLLTAVEANGLGMTNPIRRTRRGRGANANQGVVGSGIPLCKTGEGPVSGLRWSPPDSKDRIWGTRQLARNDKSLAIIGCL